MSVHASPMRGTLQSLSHAKWSGCTCTCVLAGLILANPVSGAGATTNLRVGGSGAASGGIALVAAAFGRTHPQFNIDVLSNLGSGGGIKALADGKIDIALSARPLTVEERASGLQELEYARTPMVFATRRDNPVEDHSISAFAMRFYLLVSGAVANGHSV